MKFFFRLWCIDLEAISTSFVYLHMLLQQKQYRGEIVIEEITDQNILFHSYHLEMAIYNWSGQVAGSSLNLCGSLRWGHHIVPVYFWILVFKFCSWKGSGCWTQIFPKHVVQRPFVAAVCCCCCLCCCSQPNAIIVTLSQIVMAVIYFIVPR